MIGELGQLQLSRPPIYSPTFETKLLIALNTMILDMDLLKDVSLYLFVRPQVFSVWFVHDSQLSIFYNQS